jgi:hypothetical protein
MDSCGIRSGWIRSQRSFAAAFVKACLPGTAAAAGRFRCNEYKSERSLSSGSLALFVFLELVGESLPRLMRSSDDQALARRINEENEFDEVKELGDE